MLRVSMTVLYSFCTNILYKMIGLLFRYVCQLHTDAASLYVAGALRLQSRLVNLTQSECESIQLHWLQGW